MPSNIYQFSFAPKPDWKQVFATGSEIQQYHRDVVEKFGLEKHLRLDTEVASAIFNDATWTVTTTSREDLEADFVIAATGVLHHPSIPEIPGLETFRGEIVHTARWDDSLETSGRRVGVIGTGSTGVQVFSALQKEAGQITQFARTPQWVLWAPMDLPQPRLLSLALKSVPKANDALYDVLLRGSAILADIVTKPTWRRKLVQDFARLSLKAQVRGEALRRDLTPDFEPLCKRQVLSGSYYRALQADNAALVTSDITEVTRTGIRTADGVEHPLDVIVMATGFKAHNYMRPMDLRGRDGIRIDNAWAKGPRAYRMTAIPGFPNLFTVLGPNSPTGSISLQYSAELTARYIAQWLERFRDGQFDTVEVTEEATTLFNDQVVDALGPTVWNTGCNSWYFNEAGGIDLWPFDRKTMTAMLRTPDERDFYVA